MIRIWRRIDLSSVERLDFDEAAGIAESVIVSEEHGGFSMRYRWQVDSGLRTINVEVEKRDIGGVARLSIERVGDCWLVNGELRTDLAGCSDVDLSVTPFSNSLAIRRMGEAHKTTLDTIFVDAGDLSAKRSRQSYVRVSPGTMRYRDLGLFDGFEALLEIDNDGFVERYEGLFDLVTPATK